MPAKVVHISTVHSPHDPRIYHKQCRTLARAGYDVTLVIPGREEDFQPQDGVKVLFLPPPGSRRERLTRTRSLAYREARALAADIYHFHDPELIPLGRRLKKKDNVVIYDVHEDYETAMRQKEYLPRFLAPAAGLAYRWLIALLTRPLELCLAEKYYQEKLPRGKCILNYPLLSGREAKHPPGGDKLLYTGNVTGERGAYLHARLPALDKGVSVNYIGKCSSSVADKIEEIAAPYRDRVVITGVEEYVPWEQIEDAYFNQRWLAGLALFPPSEHYEKKELTKFFEYMYAQIPILCSDFPAWKEFVEKYDCGLAVDPQDGEQVAAALKLLGDEPRQAARMGENGRRAVTAELNWQSQGKELVAWYAALLGARGKNKTGLEGF